MPVGTYAASARPSKHIVRSVIVETLRRLRTFASLEDYHYVGFGGHEFLDFQLVRRELGVVSMTSIECRGKTGRYEFNRPFADIELKFGRAHDFLTDLDWERPAIVWLDNTRRLNAEILDDVQTVVESASAGSFLAITVRADSPTPAATRLATFKADLKGLATVPGALASDNALAQWGYALAEYKILRRWLDKHAKHRGDAVTFEQLLHVQYRDTSAMLTLAGLLLHPSARPLFDQCSFGDLPFLRTGDEPLDATVPPLTTKEVAHLNSQLPLHDDPLDARGLDDDAMARYVDLYRWYPVST